MESAVVVGWRWGWEVFGVAGVFEVVGRGVRGVVLSRDEESVFGLLL